MCHSYANRLRRKKFKRRADKKRGRRPERLPPMWLLIDQFCRKALDCGNKHPCPVHDKATD